MTEKMTGAQAKEMRAALTDALFGTTERWQILTVGLEWASDERIRKLIDTLVSSQRALAASTSKEVATTVIKLHALYGQADKLTFAIKEQAEGLERLLKRIQEAG